MALLRAAALSLLLLSAWAGRGSAEPAFLSEWDFDGFVQGRLTSLPGGLAKPAGPLSTASQPARAGGDADTPLSLKRLEYGFRNHLPWTGWSLKVSAGITGSGPDVKDAYLAYEPSAISSWRLGRMRVPFGLEPQVSSGRMDTVERPLVYGFGNFGWASSLGMDFVGERDYGLRADWKWPAGFAGFAPGLSAGVFLGNGHDVLPDVPAQIMARLGTVNRMALAALRNEISLGVSASYGRNRLDAKAYDYLPIGSRGDLESDPEASVPADDLGGHAWVAVAGGDAEIRMNDLVLKGEILARRVARRLSRGYYATCTLNLEAMGLPLTLVARWEEAEQGYADGAHRPGQVYQAATAGCTWRPFPAWRLQADYLALLLSGRAHAFPGSDLFILQAQWDF